VPLSNQVTTLNHKRFKGFKMFSDGHLEPGTEIASASPNAVTRWIAQHHEGIDLSWCSMRPPKMSNALAICRRIIEMWTSFACCDSQNYSLTAT
jgi:hypothetical protein